MCHSKSSGGIARDSEWLPCVTLTSRWFLSPPLAFLVLIETGFFCVAQADLELAMKCWDYSHGPPRSVLFLLSWACLVFVYHIFSNLRLLYPLSKYPSQVVIHLFFSHIQRRTKSAHMTASILYLSFFAGPGGLTFMSLLRLFLICPLTVPRVLCNPFPTW